MEQNIFGQRKRISTYVSLETFSAIESERQKTNESLSGIVSSIIDAYVQISREESQPIEAGANL